MTHTLRPFTASTPTLPSLSAKARRSSGSLMSPGEAAAAPPSALPCAPAACIMRSASPELAASAPPATAEYATDSISDASITAEVVCTQGGGPKALLAWVTSGRESLGRQVGNMHAVRHLMTKVSGVCFEQGRTVLPMMCV